MTGNGALLEVRNLAYAYRGAIAVADVSLTVGDGEIVALLGANGAGKSTTVKVIAGALDRQSGTIRFQDEDITALAGHQTIERGMTLIPEGRLVFPQMSVLDNLMMGAYPKRAREVRGRNLERVLTIFPRLRERQDQAAGSMSGGEQQMLAIARGLMSEPRLMILDEPSLGLMPRLVQDLFRLIRSVHEQGISILLVEQNVHQALQIADRGYVLEKGAIALTGSGRELLGDAYVRKAFLGM
jgi:branched-chain amino acid transport system ATP-binding protein